MSNQDRTCRPNTTNWCGLQLWTQGRTRDVNPIPLRKISITGLDKRSNYCGVSALLPDHQTVPPERGHDRFPNTFAVILTSFVTGIDSGIVFDFSINIGTGIISDNGIQRFTGSELLLSFKMTTSKYSDSRISLHGAHTLYRSCLEAQKKRQWWLSPPPTTGGHRQGGIKRLH